MPVCLVGLARTFRFAPMPNFWPATSSTEEALGKIADWCEQRLFRAFTLVNRLNLRTADNEDELRDIFRIHYQPWWEAQAALPEHGWGARSAQPQTTDTSMDVSGGGVESAPVGLPTTKEDGQPLDGHPHLADVPAPGDGALMPAVPSGPVATRGLKRKACSDVVKPDDGLMRLASLISPMQKNALELAFREQYKKQPAQLKKLKNIREQTSRYAQEERRKYGASGVTWAQLFPLVTLVYVQGADIETEKSVLRAQNALAIAIAAAATQTTTTATPLAAMDTSDSTSSLPSLDFDPDDPAWQYDLLQLDGNLFQLPNF